MSSIASTRLSFPLLVVVLLNTEVLSSFAKPTLGNHGDSACRTFSEFSPATVETCHPYLDPTKTYYLGDTEWFDNPVHLGFNPAAYILSIFKNVMNPSCSTNVERLMCHAIFKECKEVENGVFLPSLLCRSECDARKTMWDECISEIKKDPIAMGTFENQMDEVVQTIALGSASVFGISLPRGNDNELSPFRMLECDAPGGDPGRIADADSALSWFHGQYPLHMLTADRNMTIAYAWPRNMDTRELYPEKTSKYTFSSGISVEVDCFTLEKEVEIAKIECPDKFVNPVNPNHLKPCIKPCPVAAYSDFEYTLMWVSAGLIGLLGWKLNVFMALTWCVGGKRLFRTVPYQLKIDCIRSPEG